MPSRQLPTTQAPVAAPYVVPVSGVESLTPDAVSAFWDGTGAFGDFLPCVSYYNAQGVLLDRAFPPGVVMSPGDTAEISYRPFERGGGSTPATPLETTDGVVTVTPTTELLFNAPASVTNPAPGIASIHIAPVTPALIYAQAIVPGGAWPLVEFPLPLSAGPSHGVTVGATSWTIQTAGVYQLVLFANMLHGGPEPADASMGMYWDISGVISGSGWQLPVAIGALNAWQVGPTLVEQHTLAVGNVIRFGVGHQGTAPVGLGMTMSLVRLGA